MCNLLECLQYQIQAGNIFIVSQLIWSGVVFQVILGFHGMILK